MGNRARLTNGSGAHTQAVGRQAINGLRARLSQVRTFESLAFRDYRLLWLGLTGTSMGHWMDQIARSWLIYELTDSALLLGAVGAMRAVPMLLFGVVAGVVADRYGCKLQLIVAQLTNVVLNLGLAILVTTGLIEPWHVLLGAFLAGTVHAFQLPARQVLVYDLVGQEYLTNAIALTSVVFNLMRSIGPAVAGFLIALVGIDGSYYAQAALFVLATVWTVQIRVLQTEEGPRAQRRAVPSSSFLTHAKEGFQYLFQDRLMLSVMALGLVPSLLAMPYATLMPVFARDILKVGAQGQGLMLTARGVGALLGALVIASLSRVRRQGLMMLCGAGLFGLCLVAFSCSPVMILAMAFLFLSGLFSTAYTSQNQVVLQVLSPPNLRGRLMSIRLLSRGFNPLGSMLAGALATWFGAPLAVVVMGGSCAVLTLWIGLKVPALLKLDI
jgi:MFS family permease